MAQGRPICLTSRGEWGVRSNCNWGLLHWLYFRQTWTPICSQNVSSYLQAFAKINSRVCEKLHVIEIAKYAKKNTEQRDFVAFLESHLDVSWEMKMLTIEGEFDQVEILFLA